MGVGDGVAPTILTSRDGSVAVRGGGAVDLSVAGQGAVTPIQLIPVPTAQTTGPGLVTFMTVPVVVTAAGMVIFDFAASVQLNTIPASASFQGANFSFLWDGAPIPPTPPAVTNQNSFMELDLAGVTGSDSFSNQIKLRDWIFATVGAHTLEVQFEGLAAESEVHTASGTGTLMIQGAG